MSLDRHFGLRAEGTTVRTELTAGLTTFMTMAYILAVNPQILGDAGMDRGAVFTATALASGFTTILMGLYARIPYALAPGMGLNAFFAYTVCGVMGYSWQVALAAVLVEGLIFIALTVLNVREAIIGAIPLHLKRAISVGIGLFIAYLGFVGAGVVVPGQGMPLALGDLHTAPPVLALGGTLLIGLLMARRVRGALLWGILATAAAGLPFGVTTLPTAWHGIPSLAPTFLAFAWPGLLEPGFLTAVFTLLFVDMFDTAGTLIGVATREGRLAPDGSIPRAKQALFTDAVGTTLGACLGTSTVTTYVESAAGIQAGGRTGLTSLTTGVLFLAALLLAPVFLMVPAAATAPALIIVGLLMLEPVRQIDLADPTEALPAFLTLLLMPLTGSIARGIMFGMLAWLLLKLLTGRRREISLAAAVLGVFFAVMVAI